MQILILLMIFKILGLAQRILMALFHVLSQMMIVIALLVPMNMIMYQK